MSLAISVCGSTVISNQGVAPFHSTEESGRSATRTLVAVAQSPKSYLYAAKMEGSNAFGPFRTRVFAVLEPRGVEILYHRIQRTEGRKPQILALRAIATSDSRKWSDWEALPPMRAF